MCGNNTTLSSSINAGGTSAVNDYIERRAGNALFAERAHQSRFVDH